MFSRSCTKVQYLTENTFTAYYKDNQLKEFYGNNIYLFCHRNKT
jgi:hypothetical protein